ncbi:MAG: hypothetical protein ABIB43_04725 [archaeon]
MSEFLYDILLEANYLDASHESKEKNNKRLFSAQLYDVAFATPLVEGGIITIYIPEDVEALYRHDFKKIRTSPKHNTHLGNVITLWQYGIVDTEQTPTTTAYVKKDFSMNNAEDLAMAELKDVINLIKFNNEYHKVDLTIIESQHFKDWKQEHNWNDF